MKKVKRKRKGGWLHISSIVQSRGGVSLRRRRRRRRGGGGGGRHTWIGNIREICMFYALAVRPAIKGRIWAGIDTRPNAKIHGWYPLVDPRLRPDTPRFRVNGRPTTTRPIHEIIFEANEASPLHFFPLFGSRFVNWELTRENEWIIESDVLFEWMCKNNGKIKFSGERFSLGSMKRWKSVYYVCYSRRMERMQIETCLLNGWNYLSVKYRMLVNCTSFLFRFFSFSSFFFHLKDIKRVTNALLSVWLFFGITRQREIRHRG